MIYDILLPIIIIKFFYDYFGPRVNRMAIMWGCIGLCFLHSLSKIIIDKRFVMEHHHFRLKFVVIIVLLFYTFVIEGFFKKIEDAKREQNEGDKK